jgi:hypothetical protein
MPLNGGEQFEAVRANGKASGCSPRSWLLA